jgi:hypothetical protein
MSNPNFTSPLPVTQLNRNGGITRTPLAQALQAGPGLFQNPGVQVTPLVAPTRYDTRPAGGPAIIMPQTPHLFSPKQ